jgi:hypothetical protein
MNNESVGDSYDIVKKSFISWLSEFGKWAVHPMFTQDVDSDTAEKFARFLDATLVSTELLRTSTDRAAYFETCLSAGNLLLDPDTGLSLAGRTGEKSPKYIFGDELIRIVCARPHRLTLVFDQSFARAGRNQIEDTVRKKLAALAAASAYGFAYLSSAPMLCLAADPSMLIRALEVLKENSSLPPSRLIA